MPKKKKKIVITPDEDFGIKIKQKAATIWTLEQKLAGLDYIESVVGFPLNDAENLRSQIEVEMRDYKVALAEDRARMPTGGDIQENKGYYYRQVALPMLAYLGSLGMTEDKALYLVSQSIGELGWPPYAGDNKVLFNGYADFGKKETHSRPAAKGVHTHEQNAKNNKLEKTTGNFSIYNNPYEAITKQISYLKNNYDSSYNVLFNDTDANVNVSTFARALRPGELGGYSTKKDYADKLKSYYITAKNDLPKYVDSNQMYVEKIFYQKYIDSIIAQQNKIKATEQNNNTNSSFDFLDHGMPGDPDFRPSFFNKYKYDFNYPAGKWEEKTLSPKKESAPAHSSNTLMPMDYFSPEQPAVYNITVEQIVGRKIDKQHVNHTKTNTKVAGHHVAKILKSVTKASQLHTH